MTSNTDANLADTLSELSKAFEENTAAYDKSADEYWKALPYDDKLTAFYSVVKRIHKGEVEDRRSYRGVLYAIFDFGPDAYVIGMNAGYMDIHNHIFNAIEAEKKNDKTTTI